MVTRVLLTLLVFYTILTGATYDGILDAQRRLISVILIGVVIAVWLWSRRRWRWHRTALDWAILLWSAAFALSLAANLDAWRRILIGLWYMGLYIGVWYVLQDALANRALRREWLIDAVLIAGVPVVFFGFAQIELALTSGLPIPRPVGTLGNANTLAGFLLMLIPFAAGRLTATRSALARVALAVYAVMILLLILASFSRGGWFGAAAAMVVWVSLSFPLPRLWSGLPRAGRTAVVVALVGAVGVAAYVIVESFGIGGRGIDLRTFIYETALRMFGERPVTGSGLFTFGAGLARLNSLPPFEPHSHAHNIILNVAAELGIVGLAALALTTWVAFRALRRVSDPIAIMGVAAFVGFAVHQLFDLPAMMPAIALVALIALILFVPPGAEVPRARWQPALVGAGGLILTAAGLWNAISYQSYILALSDGIANGNYRAAAERLQPLIDADPALAIYPQQQGMLLGLAAEQGDSQAIQQAAEKFKRYTDLEPSYASGWANLAAMYEALGESAAAEDAMRIAVGLAPQSWSLAYRLGIDAEAAGDAATATKAYQQTLALGNDVILLSDWDQSPLRRSLQPDESVLSPIAQTMLALERGDRQAAQQTWESYAARSTDASSFHVVTLMIALTEGDHDRAASELAQAQRAAASSVTRAWVYVGAALLNPDDFGQEIAAAHSATGREVSVNADPQQLFAADWELGVNINYIQYLSLAIPRQFLPQVGYTEADQALLHLLYSPDALAKVRATVSG